MQKTGAQGAGERPTATLVTPSPMLSTTPPPAQDRQLDDSRGADEARRLLGAREARGRARLRLRTHARTRCAAEDGARAVPSWPRMEGNRPSGSLPPRVYASVWHRAHAVSFTRTSPAFGGSTCARGGGKGGTGHGRLP